MLSPRVWRGLLVWMFLMPSSAPAIGLLQPSVVPTSLAEVAHETRPVIAQPDALRVGDGSWSLPGVKVPARADLLFSFGIPSGGGRWLLQVSVHGAAGQKLQEQSRSFQGPGWANFRIPADAWAGQVITLRMVARPGSAADETIGGALRPVVLGAPRFLEQAKPREDLKNVLLISLDTLRSDRMSVYGAALPTTPRMETLAARGMRFDTARAPASSTPPSHMTMLTGASPCTHGVWGVHVEDQPPEDLKSLAQILSGEGYSTRAVTENAFVGAPWGFARGFDSFVEFKGTPRPDGRIAAPTGLGPQTFAAARSALRDLAARRFFLFVHTYQVHAPRQPEEPYASLYPETASSKMPGAIVEGHSPADHDIRRYDQLVRQLDDLVAGLLDELDALGLRDDTLIVLTSDHGEAFFEHDEAGHGFWVWDEVLRIPLILAGPGVPAGTHSDAVVGLQDVVPTVLDLLGLPPRGGLDGRSLRPLWTGGSADEALHYAETAPGSVRALSSRRFRIHREDSREGDIAFDLAADPQEKRPLPVADWPDLGKADAAELRRLRGLLDDWAAKCRLQRETADRTRVKQGTVDPLRLEKLRALGYVD